MYSPIDASSNPGPALSACIIAFNEADRIGDCLASLAFCDEIVVVDSFSTDATVDIARAAGFGDAAG
jgi:glycosyltransferase involved in cell wall biosynthesis